MASHQIRTVELNPTLDTNAYAADDQLSTLQTVNQALSQHGLGSRLTLVTVLDKDNQGIGMDLFFFSRPVTLAADNTAFTVADADMAYCLGVVSVLAADYDAVGSASKFATMNPGYLGLALNNPGATVNQVVIPRDRVYVALVVRGGAPTYTAAGLMLRLTFETEEE